MEYLFYGLCNKPIAGEPKITNIYGQGDAADVIVCALENRSIGLTKQFRDM
jgi:hypothetical protein